MLNYYKELLLYVRNKVSDKDLAQDIVQETFEKALIIQNSQKVDNPRALLYRVCKNIIVDAVRKNKDFQEIEFDEEFIVLEQETPEDILIEQNNQEVLMKELRKLPPKMKEAFVLYVLEDYTKQEIAEIMNISFVAVEKHLSRAKFELKEKLRRKEEY
ncbi:RNA polymerase sigma factor [Aliarcobacter vitoriensis]|uniref:RNA polymerase subunit sigma n=1 Tax=Aliarcobacter vitoriensis TaxID=2011099 RepID=A0A366MSC5_9BACT|nr:RNA polymerase sigma factor [Aliarcobacter vitoriensis]RBQ29191.1 RNA polymerase subunit sigma [Aliarcobacter vitoriensis]RBQ30408.1 RNA polymerase subunit sigma [Arcobacter sp. FW59]